MGAFNTHSFSAKKQRPILYEKTELDLYPFSLSKRQAKKVRQGKFFLGGTLCFCLKQHKFLMVSKMKWFKHYSDMYKGRSINELLDQLGHTGLCFFLLQEMCAEKLDQSTENLDESAATFEFHTRIVRQNLRVSAANLRKLLGVCAEVGLLSYSYSEKTIQIKMPILLNLLDRDAKFARKTRAKSAQKPRLEEEEERDIERDKDIEEEVIAEPKKPRSVTISKAAQNGFCVLELDGNETVRFLFSQTSEKLQRSWLAAYPSSSWICQEAMKANVWITAHPHKAPKNFGRFFSNWLSTGFESYRKGLSSNQNSTHANKVQQNNDALRRKIDLGEI